MMLTFVEAIAIAPTGPERNAYLAQIGAAADKIADQLRACSCQKWADGHRDCTRLGMGVICDCDCAPCSARKHKHAGPPDSGPGYMDHHYHDEQGRSHFTIARDAPAHAFVGNPWELHTHEQRAP